MLIVKFIILFWVTTRIGLPASMLKRHISSTVFPLHLKTLLSI